MSIGSCISAMGNVENIVLPGVDIIKVMDSGQCFRVVPFEGEHRIVAGSHLAFGFQSGKDLELVVQNGTSDFWQHYFDMGRDYISIREYFKSYEGRGSEFITASAEAGAGMPLLNQDPFETLLSFIISQRKSIPAIRKCVESICDKYGSEIVPGIHAFPTPSQLEYADFIETGAGYRAAYLQDAVQAVCNGTLDLKSLRSKSYEVALEMLKHLYGVGDKVANCTLLYGLGFDNAFPIDVWVNRIIDEEFAGAFPYTAFPEYKGILQLYMFYQKRRMSGGL